MEYLRTLASPQLRDPVLIAAFEGWNDASEVATFALRYLADQWSVRKMAEIDAEEFYVFTETRPYVRITGHLQRRIEWPGNEFYYHIDRNGKRDLVLLIGVEPQLKWRTFADVIASFCQRHSINTVVTVGGLVGDVPHTLPATLTGNARPDWLARRLRRLGVASTRYEGPTGILGVLSAACARRRMATASIWGQVPEYLSASPNPRVSLAIIERLRDLLGFSVDLSEAKQLVAEFDRQVTEILAENPELQAYVQELEEQEQAERREEEQPKQMGEEPLPSGEEIVREVEAFLRRRHRGQRGRT